MRTFFGLILALFLAVPALSQGGGGSITGDVRDVTGAVIIGATVTVTGTGGFEVNTQTNSAGEFEITNVPAGVYTVTVENAGFAVFEQDGVRVTGDAERISATLGFEVLETEVPRE